MNPEHYRLLTRARLALPPGWKPELSGDLILAQAPPPPIHERNLSIVRRQFEAHCPPGHFPTGNLALASPGAGAVRVPDLTYLPETVIAPAAG
ncbi:hypothetical protein [Kitasatospora sp. NPDC101183]|uniref:hypothetical protein n=1 Tax=Kitasatospora sp. NPDC101183 TaxID=3364100 RepID=UPI0037F40D03